MDHKRLIEDTLNQMSLEQKVGQCVVIGMSGTVITNDLKEAILRYHCGGIRLSPFTRMFSYFTDARAKDLALGNGYRPSMMKMSSPGPPPYCTPEAYAGVINELRIKGG